MEHNNQPTNTTKNKIENADFWQKHIQQCQASQQTRAAYCRMYELSYARFKYWLDKFSEKKSAQFVAVKLKEERGTIATLELGNGRRILIHDINTLQMLVG